MKEKLEQMHADHAKWQQDINQIKLELKNCNQQLSDLVMNKPSSEALPQIEHFQNQFTVQKEVLDIMRHDFKQHENAIEAHQRGQLNNLDLLEKYHQSCKDRLKDYQRIFGELKDDFSAFLQGNLASLD